MNKMYPYYCHVPEDAFELQPRTTPTPPEWLYAPAQDAYEAPPYTWEPKAQPKAPEAIANHEFVADYDGKGRAVLIKRTITDTLVANFDTHGDAKLAARALNEHHGY